MLVNVKLVNTLTLLKSQLNVSSKFKVLPQSFVQTLTYFLILLYLPRIAEVASSLQLNTMISVLQLGLHSPLLKTTWIKLVKLNTSLLSPLLTYSPLLNSYLLVKLILRNNSVKRFPLRSSSDMSIQSSENTLGIYSSTPIEIKFRFSPLTLKSKRPMDVKMVKTASSLPIWLLKLRSVLKKIVPLIPISLISLLVILSSEKSGSLMPLT